MIYFYDDDGMLMIHDILIPWKTMYALASNYVEKMSTNTYFMKYKEMYIFHTHWYIVRPHHLQR
jgi:hypothetical protein